MAVDSATIISTLEQRLLVAAEVPTPIAVISSATQGPPGPAGPSGTSVFDLNADASNISAFTAVAVQNGALVAGDSSNTQLFGAIAGVATNSAQSGMSVAVQASGLLSYNGWNWTLGQPVFVGAGGILTQTAPTTGFAQVAGYPVSATELLVGLTDPVRS